MEGWQRGALLPGNAFSGAIRGGDSLQSEVPGGTITALFALMAAGAVREASVMQGSVTLTCRRPKCVGPTSFQ